jgi:uridine kinase
MLKTTLTQVRKRTGESVPFDLERIEFAVFKAAASVGGKDMPRAKRLAYRVMMLLEDRFGDRVPEVEDVQDTIEEVLITAGHVKTARAFIVYREGRRMARNESRGASRAPHGPVPYRVLWETLSWNVEHGCWSAPGLADAVASGRIDDIIRESEERFEKELDAVADQVAEASDRVRLVIVAGPSSSGKTTTTTRVERKLAARGLDPVSISVDNYFRDLEHQPRDEFGDYDYETPEAIDLPLFNDHLEKLVAGRKVDAPIFDFHNGKRLGQTVEIKLRKGQIVLVDTLHGLYKGLTARVPEEVKYKVYIEALLQLDSGRGEWVKWTDLRLLRRMARDRIHRNVTPFQTLEHWHYVRRSEKKHILPYVGDANFVLNGSFPYEVPLYRPVLLPFVEEYVRRDTGVEDATQRARRVVALLSALPALDDRESIPKNSLVREFIGGQSL